MTNITLLQLILQAALKGKIDTLFQKRINHFQSNKFVECGCNDEHNSFTTYSPTCPYNANSFTRRYFSSTYFYCFAKGKDNFVDFV